MEVPYYNKISYNFTMFYELVYSFLFFFCIYFNYDVKERDPKNHIPFGNVARGGCKKHYSTVLIYFTPGAPSRKPYRP